MECVSFERRCANNLIYNKRYNICIECEYNNKKYFNQCKLCGCFIRAKTMVDYPTDDENISIGGCPKYKW